MIVQQFKYHKYVLLLTFVFMLVACNSSENDTASEGGDGSDAYICNEWASDLVNDRYDVYRQVPKFGGREKYWWPVDFEWSPDGQRIIFRNPSQQLYWMDIDEQKPRLLTAKTGYHPVWSPDGQQVAFIITESDPYYLMVVNVETQQEMVFGTTPYVILGWTSDSERVRFITLKQDGHHWYPYLHEIAIAADTPSSGRIFPERLGLDLNFSIASPSRFVFSMPTGTDHPSLFVGDIERKDLQQVTTRRGCDQFPVWSPTSDQIVFMSDRNENWDVFLLDTRNGRDTEENLTNSPAQEYHSSWSPDGQYVAFTRFEPTGLNEAKQDIFVMNVETREIRQLTDTLDELESYPQWSPDGQTLAFVTLSQEQCHIDRIDLRTDERSRIVTIGPHIKDNEH